MAADCAHGEWGDRQVVVGEDDITLDVVGWGLCTDVADEPVDPVDPVDPTVAVFSGAFGGVVVDGD
ncbi:MAG: hypothetical protein ACPHWY_05960, partial [Pseudoalteromonas tetraodonis]